MKFPPLRLNLKISQDFSFSEAVKDMFPYFSHCSRTRFFLKSPLSAYSKMAFWNPILFLTSFELLPETRIRSKSTFCFSLLD